MIESNQQRISQITLMEPADVTKLITSKAFADKWMMPIDFKASEGETDVGTKRIPMTRVGLLTANRLVPQSFLPNKIDSVLEGSMSSDETVFTVTSGNVQKKALHTGRTSEEQLPKIDEIYAHWDSVSNDYQQYRYVPREHAGEGYANEDGVFVPIPSDLVVVDGEGTKVTDDKTAYTRQIDVNIGPSAPASGTGPLEIQNHKLVHVSTLQAATSKPSSQTTAPSFGGTFKVPDVSVNATGHVTALSESTITVPDTPATSSVKGLVVVGQETGGNDGIQPIGASASAGDAVLTISGKNYFKVAAADHVHAAGGSLTFTNTNDAVATKIYNGSANAYYDFTNMLQAGLPSAGPSASGQVLASSWDGSLYRTAWSDPEAVLTPEYAFATVTAAQSVPSSAAAIPLDSPLDESSRITLSSGSFASLRSGKTYIVSYCIGLQAQTAGSSLGEFSVAVTCGGVSKAIATHVVDESVVGTAGSPFPNFVNGTLIFTVPSSQTSCTVTGAVSSNVSWKYASGSTIQIAEVK